VRIKFAGAERGWLTTRSAVKPETRRHVNYALGYVALGLSREAANELEAIAPEDRFLPEVLAAQVELHLETKEWESLVSVGCELARKEPRNERGWIGWAFALRELNRIEEAKAVLLDAEHWHGKTSAVLHYNLACYHCLLGEIADARMRLETAFRMHAAFKSEALHDRDLERLWPELEDR
jgi:Flp pilus assembly protein TadD